MDFVFLDTETTGLDECDEVIQLSYVVSRGGKRTPVNQKFKPGCKISYSAMAVHNITEEEVEGLERLSMDSNVLKWLNKINNSGTVIVGHNIDFDIAMLEKHGFKNNMQKIDTARCSRHLLKDAEQYNLGVLYYQYGLYKSMPKMAVELGIDHRRLSSHDAMFDTLMVMLLTTLLMRLSGGPDKLIELTKTPVFIESFNFGKHKGRKVLEVAKEDPSYLEWMLKQGSLSEDMEYTIKTALGGEDK